VVARAPAPARASIEEGCTGDCDVCRSLRQALLDTLELDGLQQVEAADVAARAGATEAELAEHYGGLADCVAATYDELSDELYALHLRAFAGPGDWRSRFLAGLRAALERAASIPGAVCLLFAEEVLADPRVRARRATARERVARLVVEELEAERDQTVPAFQVEFMLGAVSRTAQTEMAAGAAPRRVAARVGETLRLLEPQGV
jgi:AcrR family transcriptional regulator